MSKEVKVQKMKKSVENKKEEIKHLEAELEQLINKGIHNRLGNDEPDHFQRVTFRNPKDDQKSPKQHSNSNRSRPTARKRINFSEPKPQKETSPKKFTYNKEEVREYIKKQREKFKQQKNNDVVKNIDRDLKKEKLRELHQKSLQLVAKNVQLKRERSKSRDNEKKTEEKAQKDTEKNLFTSNLVPDLIASNVEVSVNKNAHPQFNNITVRDGSLLKKSVCSNKNVIKENKTEVKQKVLKDIKITPAVPKVITEKPLLHGNKNENSQRDLNKNSQISSERNIIRKRNEAAVKIQIFWRNYRKRKMKQMLVTKINEIKDSPAPSVCKNVSNNTPVWLQPSYVVPHPYNFISTVKRKLQLAINADSSRKNSHTNVVEVAKSEKSVQVEQSQEPLQDYKPEKSVQITHNTDSKSNAHSFIEKNTKSSKSSDLKSFLSHKCLEPIVTKPPDLQLPDLKLSSIKTHRSSGSESDTSKDIPDISTESSTNFKGKYESDSHKTQSKLVLNKDKLKHLRLRDYNLNKNVNRSNILSNSNGIISEHVESNLQTILSEGKNDTFVKKAAESNISCKDRITSTNTSKCNRVEGNLKNSDSEVTDKFSKHSDNSKYSGSSKHSNHVETGNQNNESNLSEVQTQRSQPHSVNYSSAFASVPSSTHSVLTSKPSTSSLVSSHVSNITQVDGHASSKESIKSSQERVEKSDKIDTVPLKENFDEEINLRAPVQNIRLKSGERVERETQGNSNQIHLKFEAELHLLNNFNESLRNFINLEKENEPRKVVDLQNKDTQTSLINSSISEDIQISRNTSKKHSVEQIPTINYSRGSGDFNDLSYTSISTSELKETDESLTGFELSRMRSFSNERNMEQPSFTDEHLKKNSYISLSLEMFEQLIKDEDTRIENLKTILKIREKALLDRTRSELACLELQKKQLKATGQLQEISLLKKRQRGIIIKLQDEQLEMQRLKQAQKAASKERKTILRQQRNMIKAQLSTNEMLGKIKLNTPRERRNSGPLKVYNIQSRNESIKSETSISKRSSENEDVINVKTHSVISRVTECEIGMGSDRENFEILKPGGANVKTEHARKALLMREAELQKRRKEAEELLRWHQKLLEEEKKVTELEMAANSIITSNSHHGESFTTTEGPLNGRRTFKGSQLNSVWQNMTGRQDKKFSDKEMYSVSERAVEKFCVDAKSVLNKNSDLTSDKLSEKSIKTSLDDTIETVNSQNLINSQNNSIKNKLKGSLIEDIKTKSSSPSTVCYTSDFEISNNTSRAKDNEKISTISELIDNFSKVSKEISLLSKNNNSLVTNVDEIEKSLTRPKSFNLITDNSSIILDSIENLKSSIQEITRDGRRRNENRSTSHIDLYKKPQIDSTSEKTEQVFKDDVSTTVEEDLPTDESLKSSSEENQKTEKLVTTTEEEVKTINESTSMKIPDEKAKQTEMKVIEIKMQPKCDKSEFQESSISEAADFNKTSVTEMIEETKSPDVDGSANENSSIKILPDIKSCEFKEHTEKSCIKSESEIKEEENQESSDSSVTSEVISANKCGTEESMNNSIDVGEKLYDGVLEKTISSENKISDSPDIIKSLGGDSIPVKNSTDEITQISEIKEFSANQASVEFEIKEYSKQSETKDGVEENLETNKSSSLKEETICENQDEIDDEVLDVSGDILNKTFIKSSTSEIEDFDKPLKDSSNLNSVMKESVIIEEDKNSLNLKETSETTISEMNSFEVKERTESNNCEIEELDFKNSGDGSEISILTEPGLVDVLQTEKDNSTGESKTVEDHTKCNGEETFRSESEVSNSFKSFSNHSDDTIQEAEQKSETKNIETTDSGSRRSERIADLSYGIICKDKNEEKDITTENDCSKSVLEEATFSKSTSSIKSEVKSVESSNSDKSTPKTPVDVKKRVSEILADANSRNDKSPRLQDLYVTTYDVISPAHSPELGSPHENEKSLFSAKLYGNEAEELLKKQLAIEQEIKQLEQQQKEQIPYLFVREIPNKPPPPYTPPVAAQTPAVKSILPTDVEHIKFITNFTAEILHEAYLKDDLESVKLSEQTLALKSGASKIDKMTCEFIFDLCKEFALKHYRQFENKTGPVWMHQVKRQKLAMNRPFDKSGLEDFLTKRVKELLGFEKVEQKESAIIKWSRKKRDHVDEILVLESQSEESEWTDYNMDELIVKNEVASDIMNVLLSETAAVFDGIIAKKGSFFY